jgi:hypothetical protein
VRCKQRLLDDAFEPLHLHAERRLRAPDAQAAWPSTPVSAMATKLRREVDVQRLAHGMNSPDS